MSIFTKLFVKKLLDQKTIGQEVDRKVQPSKLSNFGSKSVWIAVKSNSTETVLSNLSLLSLKKTNWLDGMNQVLSFSNSKSVFITEPFNGWVLAIGWGLPIPQGSRIDDIKSLLNSLSSSFDEAQYFLSYRTTDSTCMIKSKLGKIERAYVISDNCSLNTGTPTAIEQKHKFIDLNSPDANSDQYFDHYTYPTNEEVSKVAETWSINPMKIERYDPAHLGTGYVAILKQN
ncbi:hypothetical protein N9B82_05050 [Saprospiraceae bacterium]|nr:hypothetical protein [Saprospiraceae bacterium]